MFIDFAREVKLAVRSFAKRPLFTAVLVLTLALGIGSNVAIFTVANAVVFRPLPYRDPEELALVWTRLPATNVERSLVSGPDLGDYQKETTLFDGFVGAVAFPGTITGDGPPEQIVAGMASWNVFDLLGVTPFHGRSFKAEDPFPIDPSMFGQPNPNFPPMPVMLSHGLWQRRFGGDPTVVGRTIQIAGFGCTIVGVLPPDFRIYLPADAAMPTNIDLWGVLPTNVSEFARDAPWLTVVARLKDGVTPEQAQQQMDALAARLRDTHQYHANQNLQIVVNGMHRDVVKHARPTILALLGAVGFVLLIACANIANLLLVRASVREREIAVRAAMGSGRGRIIGQMLTESLVLAVAGGVLGVLLAWYGVKIITALSPGNLPRIENVGLDLQVLAFSAGVTLLAAAAFGLAPALRAGSNNLANALRDRGSDSGGVRGNKLRTGLVVSEVALSIVLLVGAGLMVRSFTELRRVDPGFDADNVVTFGAPLSFAKYYNSESRTRFYADLGARIAAIPGVQSVGGVAPLPLAGGDLYSVGSYGRIGDSDDAYQANKADYRAVMPGYFESMNIELVSGRTLAPSDNVPEALDVVMVDQKFAERMFGAEDPIGKQILIDYFSEQTFSLQRLPVQIVGVVDNVRSTSLAAEGRETIYMPYFLGAFLPVTYTIRTATAAETLLPLIRTEIQAMDQDVPVSGLATLDSYVTSAMSQTRFVLALIGLFAGLALVLASLGLYGVISYSARQRTRELGVRIAFGATDRDVLRLVLTQGLMLSAAGILVGLVASVPLTRVVRSLLVGVSSLDPATFAVVPIVLLAVAAVAAYLPARRASTVDPVEALRDE
jgi:putative ABC transport system permease protein